MTYQKTSLSQMCSNGGTDNFPISNRYKIQSLFALKLFTIYRLMFFIFPNTKTFQKSVVHISVWDTLFSLPTYLVCPLSINEKVVTVCYKHIRLFIDIIPFQCIFPFQCIVTDISRMSVMLLSLLIHDNFSLWWSYYVIALCRVFWWPHVILLIIDTAT